MHVFTFTFTHAPIEAHFNRFCSIYIISGVFFLRVPPIRDVCLPMKKKKNLFTIVPV